MFAINARSPQFKRAFEEIFLLDS